MPKETPLLIRVKDALRVDIIKGVYSSPLPQMAELSPRYGVSRVTVRNALLSLQDEGLVSIRQGSGTFINSERLARVDAVNISDFRSAIDRYQSFLSDPSIPEAIKNKIIILLDGQMDLAKMIISDEVYSGFE